MKKVKKKHPFVRFIVHKVRPLQDYERSVQVNVDIENNQVILTTTKARTDRFRDEMETRSTTMILDPNRKIRRELGITRPLLPSVLMQNTVSRLQRLVDYAGLTEHKRFETSFVTYRDNPHTPEFYDLVFGKSI